MRERVKPFGTPERISLIDARAKELVELSERFEDVRPHLDRVWLIQDALPTEGIALLYGHPGAGKSFVALDMAFHIALGRPWHGRPVIQGPVIYIAAEGVPGLRRRIAALKAHFELATAPIRLLPTSLDLHQPNVDTTALIDAVGLLAPGLGGRPSLIVIDTVSKTFGTGNENTEDMVRYVANCARVASTLGCLVMLVHHRPKDAESREPRGHGSLKAGADVALLVESRRGGRSIMVVKQKDGIEGPLARFALAPVVVGRDGAGRDVESCVVVRHDEPAAEVAPMSISSANVRLTLSVIESMKRETETALPNAIWGGRWGEQEPPIGLSLKAVRDRARSAFRTERDMSEDTAKRTVNRCLQTLESDGIIGREADWLWLVSDTGTPSGQGRDAAGRIRDERDNGL